MPIAIRASSAARSSRAAGRSRAGWRARPAANFAVDSVGREPAQRAERGVDQQRVERRGLVGEIGGLVRAGDVVMLRSVGPATCTDAGASISRLRILPVGPLGSASTNHTCRGYL